MISSSAVDCGVASLFTISGRDVLFAHWPVDPDRLAATLPGPLEPDVHDGSAWVSVLALESGLGGPALPGRWFPQLNVRTYVTVDGEPGVYFRSLDSGRRVPAAVGRRVFGLPFRHARMRMTRRGDRATFRSRRAVDDGPTAVFGARYRPDGDAYEATPDSLEAFCVERFRYYLPAGEDHRAGLLRRPGPRADGVSVGRIQREPWTLRPVETTIRENTLFDAVDLPTPTADPTLLYSPGFEMGVEPLRGRNAGGERETDAGS